MSGNIHDTDVQKIKQQVYGLLSDLDAGVRDNNALTQKFEYLHSTSKTLFNFILKNYKNPKFDKTFFDKTLSVMLAQISEIQTNTTSQYLASKAVGEHIAEHFIPQVKK